MFYLLFCLFMYLLIFVHGDTCFKESAHVCAHARAHAWGGGERGGGEWGDYQAIIFLFFWFTQLTCLINVAQGMVLPAPQGVAQGMVLPAPQGVAQGMVLPAPQCINVAQGMVLPAPQGVAQGMVLPTLQINWLKVWYCLPYRLSGTGYGVAYPIGCQCGSSRLLSSSQCPLCEGSMCWWDLFVYMWLLSHHTSGHISSFGKDAGWRWEWKIEVTGCWGWKSVETTVTGRKAKEDMDREEELRVKHLRFHSRRWTSVSEAKSEPSSLGLDLPWPGSITGSSQ